MWRSVIGTKFREDVGGWCTHDFKGPYGTGMLKEIRKDWEILLARVGFDVRNGRRVQFWKDAWCGGATLCTLFPSLFALAVHKEATMADVWDNSRDAGGWSPHFSRMFNDWKLEEVERFLLILHIKKVLYTLEDKLFLREAKGGLFSVKFAYQYLSDLEAHPFPSNLIWNSWVPTRWASLRGRPLGAGSSLWIRLKEGAEPWPIDAFFAKRRRKRLSTYSYTGQRLKCCGTSFLQLLGCSGFAPS